MWNAGLQKMFANLGMNSMYYKQIIQIIRSKTISISLAMLIHHVPRGGERELISFFLNFHYHPECFASFFVSHLAGIQSKYSVTFPH